MQVLKSCRIQPALCGKVNSATYQMILEEQIRPSLRNLKLSGTGGGGGGRRGTLIQNTSSAQPLQK